MSSPTVSESQVFEQLDPDNAALLRRYGFDPATFHRLRRRLEQAGTRGFDNRVHGRLEAPRPEELTPLPPAGSQAHERLSTQGREALRAGQVGCVVLAGGMATRFGGVVKASVDALPGRSFLSLKLASFATVARAVEGVVPVYLMASFATDAALRAAAQTVADPALQVETFTQFISLRVTPEGELFRDAQGKPSPYAPGHGDVSFALRAAGLLQAFRDAGGRILFVSNVDNLGATLDPAVIGVHLDAGKAITAEVTARHAGDAGGAPARVDGGLQIVEEFRFPAGFDPKQIPVFNTNTFVFDAAAIDRDFDLTWFCVQKKVAGQPALQFERLMGELTAFLPSEYLQVPREGVASRFEPVKDPAELERRAPHIEALLRARGVL